MPADRHDCRCRTCPCDSRADPSQEACPSCSAGHHRPSRRVQDHLREGLEEWIRVMPRTAGSSGLSVKQLAGAAEVWQAWHDERPCPVAP